MGTRLFAAVFIALMALGSLAVWIAVPVGWLWVTRDLESPGARFVIVLFCCPITMVGAAALLYRVEAAYAQITQAASRGPARSWLRSVGDEPRSVSVVETFLVVSAVIALLALVGWWFFLADNPNPSGPLQPV
jgi:hypothetical protein